MRCHSCLVVALGTLLMVSRADAQTTSELARQVFEDAGFREVSHPTKRRVVMRIDFV